MNLKIIIAIIVILSAIGIIASGTFSNFEDGSSDVSETVDGDSTGRIITRGLSESVGIGTGP